MYVVKCVALQGKKLQEENQSTTTKQINKYIFKYISDFGNSNIWMLLYEQIADLYAFKNVSPRYLSPPWCGMLDAFDCFQVCFFLFCF